MYKVTLLANNKRSTQMVSGDKTPNAILAEFGAGRLQFSLNGTPLTPAAMDTPIGALDEQYRLGDTLFLTGVVKTDNA